MMSVELSKLAALLRSLNLDATLADRCDALSAQIKDAIEKHAVVDDERYGKMFAYEVDGFGSGYKMDDANLPSLLSLPRLGFVQRNDSVYTATRAFVLSANNPYHFSGTALNGIGGPHIGLGWVWPMSVITEVPPFCKLVIILGIHGIVKGGG